jgi:hypothetical protein
MEVASKSEPRIMCTNSGPSLYSRVGSATHSARDHRRNGVHVSARLGGVIVHMDFSGISCGANSGLNWHRGDNINLNQSHSTRGRSH